jgi:hypothetical protein
MRFVAALLMLGAALQFRKALSSPPTPGTALTSPDSRLAFALLERARRVSALAAWGILVGGLLIGSAAHQFYAGAQHQLHMSDLLNGGRGSYDDYARKVAYAQIPLIVLSMAGLFLVVSRRRGSGADEPASLSETPSVQQSEPKSVETGTETKECPQCAERVLARARICRFCRYDFSAPGE